MTHKTEFQSSGTSPTGPDFVLENHFSIFLLRPLSESAKAWVKEFIGPDNGFQPYFPTIVIESRYVGPILDGIRESGLVLR
jgi:hypothetical protein